MEIQCNVVQIGSYSEFAYLAVNSSKVSSSCPADFFKLVVLNADFAQGVCTTGGGRGALRRVRRAGLKSADEGVRVAKRRTEVDAISRR